MVSRKPVSRMRYERKYRIHDFSLEHVENILMNNPASFKEAFPDRIVNSIYYDNVEFQALKDNLSGATSRVKYRVRWYGKSREIIQKPVLEKKIKRNMLGMKEHEPLGDFNLSDELTKINSLEVLKEQNLIPVVLVSYLRTYLVSFDGRIRATIDRNLEYAKVVQNRVLKFPIFDSAIIVEIKYDENDADLADHCLQSIPFRLTKNSKYVSAVTGLWS